MKEIIIIILISYLLGNFQTSYILGRVFKKTDIRKFGSGNAGTTNALRVFGKKIAIATLLIDALKGVAAVMIGREISGDIGAITAGVSVVIGHNWPVFLKFKGGKGIATTIGVGLTITFLSGIISIILGILIVIKTKYVSLGSLLAVIIWPVITIIVYKPFNLSLLILTTLLAIMALYKHRSNIRRLLSGQESKLGNKLN
ncbi:glycerol-3-phosphate acyltransferase PlsY [Gottschalkia purinilytica]|uniref:Glycerol-3-phosphate acyltransferase n=1 Tax=Gottschalkia purinilytica TaxID=1503 RepID=A0A0L0WBJ7_GOTPU|nr:glycerol-3-phosphate 1-O-acyltransferase PlsY [Gottschalkia purinilytica]KNF08715.1 glycerol-3-phosphate acyltransferase PlsY [Gottschalkia purinilytica]